MIILRIIPCAAVSEFCCFFEFVFDNSLPTMCDYSQTLHSSFLTISIIVIFFYTEDSDLILDLQAQLRWSRGIHEVRRIPL